MVRLMIATALFSTLLSDAICATVISRDWKAPGDGLLTYDEANQREWFDLTESRLSMFPGTSTEERFQNALLELGPGGTLEGFTAAKSSDVLALATSAGINTSTLDFVTNAVAIGNLIALLGSTVDNPSPGTIFASGILNELSGQPARLKVHLAILPNSGPNGEAGLFLTPGVEPFQVPGLGAWLYRPVPEPSSSLLSLAYLALMVTNRRPRHSRVAQVGVLAYLGREAQEEDALQTLAETTSCGCAAQVAAEGNLCHPR